MVTPTNNMTPEERKDFRKAVGKRLQELRKGAGFGSATAFAKAVGFNPNTYTQYEQGITGFDYEKAWIMADALNCSIDALGGRKPPRTYADPDQERINRHYEDMTDEAKKRIAETVDDAHRNPRNIKRAEGEGESRRTA